MSPRDLTLRGMLDKLVHALTSFDARTMRSFSTLVRRPGKLTLAWTSGVRKPYVAPFQLFLIANVLFFAIQGLTGESVFSSPLSSHLHVQDWKELAQTLLDQRLAATGRTREQFEPAFDHAVALHAKSLILLMSLPFTLLLPLTFLREHRPFVSHLVFSLHLYTFLLLVFCAALLAAKLSAWAGLGDLDTPAVDNVLTIANLAACAAYVYLAIGSVYGATGAARAIKSVLLVFAVGAIVLGYRFLLFLITLYTT